MKKRSMLILGGATIAALTPTTDAFAEGDEEAQRQAARLISQAVGQRIGGGTDLLRAGDNTDDSDSSAFWAIASVSQLTAGDDFASAPGVDVDFDTSLALLSVGFDADRGSVVGGVAFTLNVSSSEFETSMTGSETLGESTGVGISVTPYGALKMSDNFFLSGLISVGATYVESDIEIDNTPGPDFSMTSSTTFAAVGAEVAANYVNAGEHMTFRGKAAYRGNFFIPEEGEESFASTVVLSGEAEFNMGSTTSFYISAETNYVIDDNSDEDRYPVYVGAGLNFRPSENMRWGVGYQTEFGDDTTDIHSLVVNARWTF